MHEQSLACALLKQVDELRASFHASPMRRVKLTVGEFSGVDSRLLQSAFDRATDGTPLAGVDLSICSVPLMARCGNCVVEFRVHGFRFICPACGATEIDIIRGEELMLESVTFEETAQ